MKDKYYLALADEVELDHKDNVKKAAPYGNGHLSSVHYSFCYGC